MIFVISVQIIPNGPKASLLIKYAVPEGKYYLRLKKMLKLTAKACDGD